MTHVRWTWLSIALIYLSIIGVLQCAQYRRDPIQVPGECDLTWHNDKAEAYAVDVTNIVTSFNTLQNVFPSELSLCLPSPHHLPDTIETRLYTVRLNGISMGDVLMSNFTAEVTSELPVGALVEWYVEIKRVDTGEQIFKTPSHGGNLLPEEHHKVFGEQLYYQFEQPGDYQITVIAYSAFGNFDLQVDNSHLEVNLHYGSLQGIVFRERGHDQ